jgi:hypothetical protein
MNRKRPQNEQLGQRTEPRWMLKTWAIRKKKLPHNAIEPLRRRVSRSSLTWPHYRHGRQMSTDAGRREPRIIIVIVDV